MKLNYAKQLLIFIIVSLILNAFLSPYWGLYADDWVQVKAAISVKPPDLVQYFINSFIYNGELRPFRAFEWIIKNLLFRVSNYWGIYCFQACILGICAWLLFLILRRYFNFRLAFTVSLLFLLSPIDSTSQWLATFHWKFSLLFSLWASLEALKARWLIACILLIFSLLFHEAPIGIFCLVPFLLLYKKQNKQAVTSILSLVSVFICYVIWRKGLAPLYMEDFRLSSFLNDGNFNLLSSIIKFCKRIFYGYMSVLILPIGILVWKMNTFYTILNLLISFVITKYTQFKIKFQASFSIIVLGLLTIPFAYWLSLYQAPARHLGMDSKMNLPASISFAFILFGLISFLSTKIKNQQISKFLIVFIFGILVNIKFLYQYDYLEAKNIQNSLYAKIQDLNLSNDKIIIFNKSYDHNKFAIEPIAPYGGPWSAKYTVYPAHHSHLINKRLFTEIWVDGACVNKIKSSNLIFLALTAPVQ